MKLNEQIQNDLKAALLERRRFEADVLRNLKAAILNQEVALGKREDGLSDTEILDVISKEVKKRQESLKMYSDAGRNDLAENEQNEIDVLAVYLPKQLTEEELQSMVDEIITEIGDVSIKDMGSIIGRVKSKAGVAADGALVAKIVKQTLNQK